MRNEFDQISRMVSAATVEDARIENAANQILEAVERED